MSHRLLLWLGRLLIFAALLGGFYLLGLNHGADSERAKWQERMLVAERAARHTEHDLAGIAAAGAKRIAEKEALLDEQARRQTAQWRATLERVPDCRIPRAVGVQLDIASGAVPAAPAVAAAPEPGPDDPALVAVVRLADELDVVRENYRIARVNIGRLIEARNWYEAIRERVNGGQQWEH